VFSQRTCAMNDDAFEISMARGALRIRLGCSSIAADASQRYRVHGLRASYRKSGLDVQEQQLRAGLLPTDPAFGIEPSEQWGTLIEGSTGSAAAASHAVRAERGDWCAFYRALRGCIEKRQGSAAVPVPASQAREVIRIIELARRSSLEARRMTL